MTNFLNRKRSDKSSETADAADAQIKSKTVNDDRDAVCVRVNRHMQKNGTAWQKNLPARPRNRRCSWKNIHWARIQKSISRLI